VTIGAARRLAASALLALGGACASSDPSPPALLGLEGRDRETLAAAYPPGTPRSVVRARESEALVFSIHPCTLATVDADPPLAAAVEAFRAEYPAVAPSCDRVRLARTGWVTLVGGLAYYQDYVFYDAAEQVLVAYRTFIQRSGD
jgi:hypothetical protein